MKRFGILQVPRPTGASLDAAIERWAFGLAIAACVWFHAVAFWGIDSPATAGHFMSGFSVGIGAENMLHWKTLYPVLHYIPHSPVSANYYMHHPFGIYWSTAFFIDLFGHHAWVVRFAPALFSGLTCVFLYKIGRAVWGPIEGACAALAFSVLPITLGFANFNNLEVPLMWGTLFSTWAYLRMMQTGKARYLWLSVFGFAFALNQDWEAFVWAGALLAFVFFRAFAFPRIFAGTFRIHSVALWWSTCAGIAALTVVYYGYALQHSGMLSDLLAAYSTRAAGNEMPLADALKARAAWIEMTFLPTGVLLGKMALPVVLFRFLVYRTDGEFLPLPIFAMALFQYIIFKNGADFHIFWPHPFGLYFALGVGALVASARDVFALVTTLWSSSRKARAINISVIAVSVLILGWMGVSSLPLLRYARSTAGEMTHPFGKRAESQIRNMVAAKWFADRVPVDTVHSIHGSFLMWYHLEWTLHDRVLVANQSIAAADSPSSHFFALDSRNCRTDELEALAKRHTVHMVDGLWFVDNREDPGPVEGYVFQERKPKFWEWYFKEGGTEPMRTVKPDPWQTWEQRTLLRQPAPIPAEPPVTPEQIRIQHNVAVSYGRADEAARYAQILTDHLNHPQTNRYDQGTELLGISISTSPANQARIYFRAGKSRGNHEFRIYSTVKEVSPWLLVARDTMQSNVGGPFAIQTSRWIEGHIYALDVDINKRPGVEQFFGGFATLDGSPAPRSVSSADPIGLFELN